MGKLCGELLWGIVVGLVAVGLCVWVVVWWVAVGGCGWVVVGCGDISRGRYYLY